MDIFGKYGWFWEPIHDYMQGHEVIEDFEYACSYQTWERGLLHLAISHNHEDGARLCKETLWVIAFGREIFSLSRFPHC
jgi:hypothetical protein